MKPYWLFFYSYYYPSGGMGDYTGAFTSYEDAYNHLLKLVYDNGTLLDSWGSYILNIETKELKELYIYNNKINVETKHITI